jgi:DNA primase
MSGCARFMMTVIPSKGIYHCFVCGAGGDVFSFVQNFLKMEFREALEHLAERAGIALTPRRLVRSDGEVDGEPIVSRSDLLAACKAASDFFRAIYEHPEHGKAGREVISRRRISPEMVSKFQIGVAPDRWDGLLMTLRKMGHSEKAFLDAGLLKAREGGDGFYDAFRNRLMFPIRDQVGRVIAFGGRKIKEEDEPKYLNSPDTRLFNKSATLYGLDHASKAMQAARTAIVTEGYTDTIACHQGGFANAVAALGTAFTEDHAAMLARLCDRVVLLFDGDEAGQRAADRCVKIFLSHPIDVRIVTLSAFTDAKDPDELLKREGGEEIFKQALEGARDLLEYRFSRLREKLADQGMAAMSRGIDEEIGQMVEWGLREVPPVRQALIVRRLAELAGVSEDAIRRSIPAGRKARSTSPVVEQGAASDEAASDLPQLMTELRSPGLGPAEHLLGCVLVEGELWLSLSEPERDLMGAGAYRSRLLSMLAQAVNHAGLRGDAPGLEFILAESEDLEIKQAATALHQRVQLETQGDRERLHNHWKECLRRAAIDRVGLGARAESQFATIELKRRVHTALGPDRRVLPRPS